jgi:hypothetical protein
MDIVKGVYAVSFRTAIMLALIMPLAGRIASSCNPAI